MSEFLESYIRNFRRLNPWAEFFDVRIEKMEPGFARLVLPYRREYTHSLKVVQGGVVTAIADAAVAHAIMPMLEPGQSCTTVELKINFLAACDQEGPPDRPRGGRRQESRGEALRPRSHHLHDPPRALAASNSFRAAFAPPHTPFL
jgi:hypothetical protein